MYFILCCNRFCAFAVTWIRVILLLALLAEREKMWFIFRLCRKMNHIFSLSASEARNRITLIQVTANAQNLLQQSIIKANLISIELPNLINNYGLYALAIVLIIRAMGDFKYVGFFKTIKNTPFADYDTRYYSPLCLFLGLNILVIQYLMSR